MRKKKAESDVPENVPAAGAAKDRIARLRELDEAERREDEAELPEILPVPGETSAEEEPEAARRAAERAADEALLRLDDEKAETDKTAPAPVPEAVPEDAVLPAADQAEYPAPAAADEASAPAETDKDRMFRRIDFFDRGEE